MGAYLSKILEVIFGKKECNILIVGLDGAGKTSILYKLNLGEIVATMPTIGFHVESVEYKNWTFTVLDLPLQHLEPLWKHYFRNTQGVIFVVDSNDRETIDDCSNEYSARKQLHGLLTNVELRNAVLLVCANKQDLPNAMSLNEVAERLGLDQLRTRQWYLQSTSAVNGKGLYEGLDWLSNTLNKKQN